jgi:hypothetical protein
MSMWKACLAATLVLSAAPAHAVQPADADRRLEDIRAELSTGSLRAFRRAVARGEFSAGEITEELELWRRYVELRGRGPESIAAMAAEVETFGVIRGWSEWDPAAFETLMAEILAARGGMQPHYDPDEVRDAGLPYSPPYTRWALLDRGEALGPAGRLLLAADRGRGDGLWWEQVDLAYWQAEADGADPALLDAFRAILRGYIERDFDRIDYDWVRRSTGSEFMRNPAIPLAFDRVDEARTLRADRPASP